MEEATARGGGGGGATGYIAGWGGCHVSLDIDFGRTRCAVSASAEVIKCVPWHFFV